jgi:hypothetical protein
LNDEGGTSCSAMSGNGAAIGGLAYKKRVVALLKLANTSRDDVCMIVLLVSLLVTTLLLPWIVV